MLEFETVNNSFLTFKLNENTDLNSGSSKHGKALLASVLSN